MGLGGAGQLRQSFHPRFLEKPKYFAHQLQRTAGGSKHHYEFCKTRGVSKAKCGQHSRLVVSKKLGGRKDYLNDILQPLFRWCWAKNIQLEVQWVPSKEMQADHLTRWEQDRGDYTLNPHLFQKILTFFHQWLKPDTDMFASPGNRKFHKFVTRYPHFQALKVDALNCDLGDLSAVYANPPWKVILKWLQRLSLNKQVKCLLITPMWVSAAWWPQLIKMSCPKSPQLVIPPVWGMFTDCWGEVMPPPKWPLACTIVSGSYFKGTKCKMQTSWLP
jgi:hypothetical protein